MSTEQQVAKVSKRKKSESSGEGKKGQEVDKLSACHARNALFGVKGVVHLNDEAMKLLAKGMQDYEERLVDEASFYGERRDSHKNLITTDDIIKAADLVPMIFPPYLFEGYVEKERKPKVKKVKSTPTVESRA
jgi:hypothetical protein